MKLPGKKKKFDLSKRIPLYERNYQNSRQKTKIEKKIA